MMIDILNWQTASKKRKDEIFKRSALNIADTIPQVAPWMDRVKAEGDDALLSYIQEFDDPDFSLECLRISDQEIKAAYDQVDPQTFAAIAKQVELSRTFQEKQMDSTELMLLESVPGVLTGKRVSPVDSVGLYIPAGSAPLPTVMQVLGTAAKSAGVERIIACFPPQGRLPEMLVAADLAGVDELYAVGGVAAIAAMAYGTETIAPVCKIVGPGSIYVQAAKSFVRDDVAIDMIAGPSEGLMIADERANPAYLAADILAKAEHDPNAAGVLVTWSQELAEKTKQEIERLYETLSRKEIIKASLQKYCSIIFVADLEEAIAFSNDYSPEHLEVLVEDPIPLLARLRNAGSIFLGDYAPIAVGDYASGTNHVLPTGIWPKTASPVSVRTFQKESEVQYLTREGLGNLQEVVQRISDVEGLDAHRLSVDIRFSS